MNYTYQVAYLNTIRTKKVIPKNVLQELATNKNIVSLISVLKEYRYDRIFSLPNPEIDLYDATLFETVVSAELEYTVSLIDSLLLDNDKWLVEWFSYFYPKNITVATFDRYIDKFQNLHSMLCNRLLKLVIDFENIKLFLSYINSSSADTTMNFLSGGNIHPSKFKDVFPSLETLVNILNFTFYPKIKLTTSPVKENFNFYFNLYLEELVWESRFYFFTIEPVVFYFFEKLLETQKLKEIYYELKLST